MSLAQNTTGQLWQALDDREHIELLPEGYNPVDPEAEEQVWISVR